MPKAHTDLRCPHCGYDGRKPTENGTFRLLRDITSYHEVRRLEPQERGKAGILYVP